MFIDTFKISVLKPFDYLQKSKNIFRCTVLKNIQKCKLFHHKIKNLTIIVKIKIYSYYILLTVQFLVINVLRVVGWPNGFNIAIRNT